MTVTDILEKRGWGVLTIDGGARVSVAIGAMRRERLSALVVSADGRQVDGILTEHELVRAFRLMDAGTLMDIPVRKIMCRRVLTCTPDESLRRVMSRMAAQRVRHIIVVDAHGIWGVVNMAEIVDQRLREAEREVETTLDYCLIAS